MDTPAIMDSSMLETLRADGWENIITTIGTDLDKRLGGRLIHPAPNVSYQEWEDLYFADDLAATIAEIPALEMVRQWIEIMADDPALDKDQDGQTEAEDLTTEEKVTVSKRVQQKLDELEAKQNIFESLLWSRVFGGSLLFLGIDDGGGDNPKSMQEPLNENRIESFDHLTVFDRWDVHIARRFSDPRLKNFGQPEFYRINDTAHDGIHIPGADLIHASRFIRFDGTVTNRRRTKQNGGWADSIFVRLRDLIRDFNLSWGGVSHILQDFAQAIFKMRGLRDAILADKDDLVLRRMAIIDRCRSSSRAIPLDAQEEDFDRKQTPIAGLPETLDRFAWRIAAAARQPVTLLFGRSPAGLQATGASDIRFFYDRINAMQESMLRSRLERLIRLIFLDKSGPTKGVEPEDWSFDFNPLFQLTEKEQAEVRKVQAETDGIYLDQGVLDEDEVTYSRFGGDKYSTATVLDLEKRNADKMADDREGEETEPETPAPAIEPGMQPPGIAPNPGEPPTVVAVQTPPMPEQPPQGGGNAEQK
jgi:phage-related protein (TIGR01555 family)